PPAPPPRCGATSSRSARSPRRPRPPGERPAFVLYPADEQPAGVRAGTGVSVDPHPGPPCRWVARTPSLQGGPDEQRGEELQLGDEGFDRLQHLLFFERRVERGRCRFLAVLEGDRRRVAGLHLDDRTGGGEDFFRLDRRTRPVVGTDAGVLERFGELQ